MTDTPPLMTDGTTMSVGTFLATAPAVILGMLVTDDARRFRNNEPAQVRAYEGTIACLRGALGGWPAAADWQLVLEYPIRRLGRRIDAVLVSERAVIVLEFKSASRHEQADRRQVEDYALDLQDFHRDSRGCPIVPILVAEAVPGPVEWELLLAGAGRVIDASPASLPGLLRELAGRFGVLSVPIDPAGWPGGEYHPVPGIVDAARTLYARHGVTDITTSRAGSQNLGATSDAIAAAIAGARADGGHRALFVTGIPGAGKTLCGLNAVFGVGRATQAAFLTGNPTLVHVLREALARDAAVSERIKIRDARRNAETSIQALPLFRDTYVRNAGHTPPEHVIVIDEAQRAWSAGYAIAKSRGRDVPLTDSEPGHLLDIMARHGDWAVVVCLVGNGQEIHDGEGGLAEWGVALERRPGWRVSASPGVLTDPTARQQMPRLAGMEAVASLHLDVPVRSIRCAAAAPWVDAVLLGDARAARRIAETSGPVPFRLTRDLALMRGCLREGARGLRRAGLVASSGARRLRADGLGAELPHMDDKAVANWFLDRWPEDVRASDALEVVATEFSCQGLELDHVGLCWGGDMIRAAGGWRVRRFAGTNWQNVAAAERVANQINTYRVLLTRARYETVIWVPRGDVADRTRGPGEMDGVADFLVSCGVMEVSAAAAPVVRAPPQGVLV